MASCNIAYNIHISICWSEGKKGLNSLSAIQSGYCFESLSGPLKLVFHKLDWAVVATNKGNNIGKEVNKQNPKGSPSWALHTAEPLMDMQVPKACTEYQCMQKSFCLPSWYAYQDWGLHVQPCDECWGYCCAMSDTLWIGRPSRPVKQIWQERLKYLPFKCNAKKVL